MTTKHHLIRNSLVQDIEVGTLAASVRLPGEKELALQFGVSVGTVVRALDSMTREGWLVRRRGSGTYVRTREVQPPSGVTFVVPYDADVADNEYLSPMFHALRHVCFAGEVPLKIASEPDDAWLTLPERFADSAFYIVSPLASSRGVLTELWKRNARFVVVGASWNEPVPFPAIDSDNRAGARRAVEYLLHLGHRRILIVNADTDSANCLDRQQGYRDALAAYDLEADPALQLWTGSSMEISTEVRNHLTDLLLQRDGCTAIFCAGYYLALEVMQTARRLGLRIPEDISLIGVDDPRSASYLEPPLTTLRQPLQEIGAISASRLLAIMRNEDASLANAPLCVRLPMELITRASCLPFKAK